jgi:Mce-associated membrane protein
MAANADTPDGQLNETAVTETSPDRGPRANDGSAESLEEESAEPTSDAEPQALEVSAGRKPRTTTPWMMSKPTTSPTTLRRPKPALSHMRLAVLVDWSRLSRWPGGWLGFRAYQAHQAVAHRELFVQFGRQGALNPTTIDWQHADTDINKAQVNSVGTITEAGLESESGDDAQVLVAVSVNTSNSAAAQQQPRALAYAHLGAEGRLWGEGLRSRVCAMTNLRRGAGDRPKEPEEKETAAVRVSTDNATDQDHTTVGEATTETLDRATRQSQDTKDAGDAEDTPLEDSEADQDSEHSEPVRAKRRISWSRVLVFGVLPTSAMLLTVAAAFSNWEVSSVRVSEIARIDSVAAAKDSSVALLSYKPDSVEKDLEAARDRLTGTFQDSYTQLVHDVVIPGAKQKGISATATVPAAASVSATRNHAVVLVFINQTVVVGTDKPTDTASSVRVTLDKIRDRWLISGFDPV